MDLINEVLDELDIVSGEKIWLSSDVIKLAFMLKKEKQKLNADYLIDCIINRIGPDGTILIPTFSFEFSNCGFYDYSNSVGTTGILGNVALRRPDFKRTSHPMHSFAVYGSDKDLLVNMNNKHSFGEDSPFRFCLDNDVRQIMLGTDYTKAMTYVHYVETVCCVPYRFLKLFSGAYITEEGKEERRTYEYAARRLDVGTIEQFNRIGKVLEEKGIAHEYDYKGYISHDVRLGECFDVIKNDIMNNKCRQIYDFEKSREDIFDGFP